MTNTSSITRVKKNSRLSGETTPFSSIASVLTMPGANGSGVSPGGCWPRYVGEAWGVVSELDGLPPQLAMRHAKTMTIPFMERVLAVLPSILDSS
jgi:hypothetical protein